MRFKTLTKRFFLIDIVIAMVISIGLGIYDPLHIFHKSWVTEKDRIHGDMRVQAAGIINNYNFDSFIIGTSMLKGSSAILVSEKLGEKFVNLSPNGASISERRYITEYALKKKKIKSVIISFDTGLDQNLIVSNPKFPVSKFNYLYDEASLNDLKAYWNYKFVGCLASFSTSTYCLGNKRTIQRPVEWFDKLNKRNQNISGIENWVHNKKGRGKAIHSRVQRHIKRPIASEKEYKEKLELSQEIIERSLFSSIESHKGVEFYVVFPPYSRFLYSLWKNKNPYKFLLYKETLRYFVKEGSKYKNLKIYSFDDMQYLDDLNNYRDMRHYNTDMNEMMLDAIANGKHLITIENVDAFLEVINKMSGDYNLNQELDYLLNSYL
ncbi:hypothetical protein ACFL4I_01210 [Pseudomonadota bacterium]